MKTCLKIMLFLIIYIMISCAKNNTVETDTNDNNMGWIQLGNSFENPINDIIADEEGNIYMSGGKFKNIEKWNGLEWIDVGNVSLSQFTGGLFSPITVDKEGNIYAVGRIMINGGNAEYHIAKWDKSSNTWLNLTSKGPLFNNGIHSLVTDIGGNLFASGNVIDSLPPVKAGNYVYWWDGNSWNMLGESTLPGGIILMHISNNRELYVSSYNDVTHFHCVLKWSGSEWETIGGTNSFHNGNGQINCIGSDSKGNIYAGGYFEPGDYVNAPIPIYKWTKSSNSWNKLNTCFWIADVYSIAFDDFDSLYIAGRAIEPLYKTKIEKYQDSIWTDYGNLNETNNVNSICFDKYGNMYAGGTFSDSEGKYYVAILKKR